MKTSAYLSLLVLLSGCLSCHYASAAFHIPGLVGVIRQRYTGSYNTLPPQHQQQQRQSFMVLHEKKGGSFFDLFRYDSDSGPSIRKSLGIEDDDSDDNKKNKKDDDTYEPHPPDNKPPELYFSEDTGKPLPNWTPPPVKEEEPPKEEEAPPSAEKEESTLEEKVKEEIPEVKPTPTETKKEVRKPIQPRQPILTKEQAEEVGKTAKVVVEKVVVRIQL